MILLVYTFFKIVQNKLFYAITGKTAVELIYESVDSDKEYMGLLVGMINRNDTD